MPEERALIRFRCVAEDHQEPGSRSDTLTIHQGKWAFCPHDIRAKAHRWEDTGGITLTEVRRLADRARPKQRKR
ncbi:MAG TPA: hypothetical protein VFC31_14310 [Candidatus Limnocylindria bacterium]|nr:hypothetical protein [Candidatus Limnocylindria bacterium]